jgi:hypothetical protein
VAAAAGAAFLLQSARVRAGAARAVAGAARRLDALSPRVFALGLFAAALAAGLLGVPGYRWAGAVSGDEPKYLRIAASLAHDLDADVARDEPGPPTAARTVRNAGRLAAATASALAGLARAELTPEPQWNRGNWTIAGRRGGEYHVMLPGLPALLAVPLALEERVLGERADHPLLTVVMVMMWAAAVTQAALLAGELAGRRLPGLAAGAAACATAPVFVGALHFYPEAPVLAAAPWLARVALAEAPRPWRVVLAALAAGALVWLHPKFALLAAAAGALLAWRARRTPRRLAAIGAAWAAPVLALLLLAHHVTGLLRPDAFYVRYGSDLYSGAGDVLRVRTLMGLFNAFFAARDGLFVLAPVLMAGVFAAPWAFAAGRRRAGVVSLLFAATWLAAATHMGAAPGPPGRLMAPAAWALAAALAVGLSRPRERAGFQWCAALLLLASLAVTVSLAREWRRTVNPFRGLAPEVNFARDLPDHPRAPGERPYAPSWELAKGALLFALVAAGTAACARRGPALPAADEAAWRGALYAHLGLWAALAVAAYGLHALAPPR